MESRMEFQYLVNVDRMDKTELYRLMTTYGDDVTRYAYAITKNREQAKDIAQEVFIKVFHDVGTFKGRSSLKTWLFSITRNLAINELKSSYMRRIVLFGWVKPQKNEQSAEMNYFMEQSVREIRDIIMSLPNKLREVLLLTLEHELTMIEIAKLINVSEGTVKSRLHRARKIVNSKWREIEP
ncbi:RNA polymerase sigma factor [Paenibacillus soyae]|uniref:RNA polymerase sigma factor n=1 Tax=Paenibacillus soyae TaxID=2969249 RepID=A0A9X2SAA7_9BACL|nr:RNA polymerase sigma factor [Paenibacillus soyae]MCR2806031.1 RNA polymerase sigma factor [Paenibacillus soyae]